MASLEWLLLGWLVPFDSWLRLELNATPHLLVPLAVLAIVAALAFATLAARRIAAVCLLVRRTLPSLPRLARHAESVDATWPSRPVGGRGLRAPGLGSIGS